MIQEHRNDELVKMIQKMTRFLRDERVDYATYASNVIIHLVGEPLNCIEDCLADLSEVEKNKLVNFSKAYFEEKDFAPRPRIFMVDSTDPTEVEKKRQELRPKFQQLMKDLKKV